MARRPSAETTITIVTLSDNFAGTVWVGDPVLGSFKVDTRIHIEETPFYGTDGSYLDEKQLPGNKITFQLYLSTYDYEIIKKNIFDYDEYPYILFSSSLNRPADGAYAISTWTPTNMQHDLIHLDIELTEAVGIYTNAMRKYPAPPQWKIWDITANAAMNYTTYPVYDVVANPALNYTTYPNGEKVIPHIDYGKFVSFGIGDDIIDEDWYLLRHYLNKFNNDIAVTQLRYEMVYHLQRMLKKTGMALGLYYNDVMTDEWIKSYKNMLMDMGYGKETYLVTKNVLNVVLMDKIRLSFKTL
jgi:hypothetical protein